jgi:mono/diheme cytochrome c family protein
MGLKFTGRRRIFARRLGGALLCAVVFLGAAALAQETPQTPFLSAGRGFDEQDGAAIYAHVCAACHQADAKGAIGAAAYPALADDNDLVSADYIMSVLFNGLRSMPPLGRMMSDAQVAEVTNYVRTHFAKNYADTLSAEDVKAARP